MKLKDLNLTVTDVAETRKLFETYFGFTGLKEVSNDKFTMLFGNYGREVANIIDDLMLWLRGPEASGRTSSVCY